MKPPERLLKKKCQCGSLLTYFSLVGIPYMPEWFSLALCKEEIESELPWFAPGLLTTNLIMGMAFTSECKECGSITAWSLDRDEFEYLISNEREKEYAISWIYNPKSIEDMFGNFKNASIKEQLIRIAKMSEEIKNKIAG